MRWVRHALCALAAGGVALVLAGGAAGAAAPPACPAADATPSEDNREDIARATICLVNRERAARGLHALALDPRLDEAARAHTDDMRRRGYFSHTGRDGSSPSDRARAAGYPADASENILEGRLTPAQAVALWMDSSRHRGLILGRAFKGIGAAYADRHWTQVYGAATPPGGSPAGAGTSRGGAFPAKLQVLRARVRDGRLDVLAELTARANGDPARITFIARGRRSSFTHRVAGGRLRVDRALPAGQRGARSGIVEIAYGGNARVRPADARLRAARGRAKLRRSALSLRDGVLRAEGTIASAARGVVRLTFGFTAADGGAGAAAAVARIDDGRWSVEQALPAAAREGGYLTIQFTGYLPQRLRGEQIAKQVLAGQAFGG